MFINYPQLQVADILIIHGYEQMETWQALLNGNWANIVVAAATAVLAFLTWLLWRETSKTRHYNQSADIVVGFEIHQRFTNAINLVLENVGAGLAKNLKLEPEGTVEIPLKSREKLVLNEWNLFKKTIPTLKSRQQIKSFAFMYHELADPEKTKFKIKAEWEDYKGKKVCALLEADASVYEHITYLGHDPFHEIAEAQKKISKNFEQVLNNKRIKVETITSSELKEQNEKFAEEMRERRKAKAEAEAE